MGVSIALGFGAKGLGLRVTRLGELQTTSVNFVTRYTVAKNGSAGLRACAVRRCDSVSPSRRIPRSSRRAKAVLAYRCGQGEGLGGKHVKSQFV
jgi:hypothetical protein